MAEQQKPESDKDKKEIEEIADENNFRYEISEDEDSEEDE
jgi:hypothetical protein